MTRSKKRCKSNIHLHDPPASSPSPPYVFTEKCFLSFSASHLIWKFPKKIGVLCTNQNHSLNQTTTGSRSRAAVRTTGATTEDENGTWFVDSAKKLNTINNMVNALNTLDFQDVQQLKQEKGGLSPNETNGTVRDACWNHFWHSFPLEGGV
ncbi:hypothetical protein ACE6H2_017119 [Prunus campanulata]